jgi:hypothetical protein
VPPTQLRTVAFPPTEVPIIIPEEPYTGPQATTQIIEGRPVTVYTLRPQRTTTIPAPPIQIRPIANIPIIPLVPADFPAGPAGFQHLPQEVLIDLLMTVPPDKIALWCATNTQIRAICQSESFMLEMIRRRYRLSLDKIPGTTIAEKYGFISIFDSRYFMDPDFVRVSANYLDLFGPDYTSRKSSDDALETIISIWRDSTTADLSQLVQFKHFQLRHGGTETRSGAFNHNFVTLLSGAIMTKSEVFAKSILDILIQRLLSTAGRYSLEQAFPGYSESFRYPFILSIEYGMPDTIKELRKYYDPYGERFNAGSTYEKEVLYEIDGINSDEILDRFLPYLNLTKGRYWLSVYDDSYTFADRILNELLKRGQNPYAGGEGEKELKNAREFRSQAAINYISGHMNLATGPRAPTPPRYTFARFGAIVI